MNFLRVEPFLDRVEPLLDRAVAKNVHASIFSANDWKVRIHLVDVHGATDILDRDSLSDGPVKPARRTLVADLSDVPGLRRVDNVEGITLGPRLPDGRRTVLLVSDDNFSSAQTTQFLAFAATGI
ncbi:hypothetical protein SipoB123_18505 [Streptomyces ipomoeae]|nr:hypothetical protein SipoB123_18505 [Streptomyces ipomoeae]